MASKKSYGFKKKRNLNTPLSLLALVVLTLGVFVGGYLNSQKLNVNKSDAYQGESCSGHNPGETRCYMGTQVETCYNNVWNVSTCSTNICSSTTGNCATPTPTPPPTCSAGMHNCTGFNTIQVCSNNTWYSASCGDTGCNSTTNFCNTPTPIPPSTGCFLAGTKIATANGTRNIEDITTTDNVLSYDGNENIKNSNVSKIYKVTRSYYYEITTNKTTVKVTAEHPFYNGNNQYTEAQNLKVGDIVYLLDNNRMKSSLISKIVKVNQKTEAYNLSVDTNHTFFANSFAVHNKTEALKPTACQSLAASKGIQPATPVGQVEYNYWTTKDPTDIGRLCGQALYVGSAWKVLGVSKYACCVLPSDNNTTATNYCSGLTQRDAVVTVQFAKPGDPAINNVSDWVQLGCKTGTTNACIRNYNYDPLVQSVINRTPSGAQYFIQAFKPTANAASCSWLSGNSLSNIQAGFCCP